MPVFFGVPLARKERDNMRDLVCYRNYPIAELDNFVMGQMDGWRSDLTFTQGVFSLDRGYTLPILKRDRASDKIFLTIQRLHYCNKLQSDYVVEPFRQSARTVDFIDNLSTEDGGLCDLITLQVKIYDMILLRWPGGYRLYLILKTGVSILESATFSGLRDLVAGMLPEQEGWRLSAFESEGFGKERWKNVDLRIKRK